MILIRIKRINLKLYFKYLPNLTLNSFMKINCHAHNQYSSIKLRK